MQQVPNHERASAFLQLLWPGKPETAAHQLWEKTTKKSYTYADSPTTAKQAADRAEQSDVYLAASVVRPQAKVTTSKRLSAADALGIPGVWFDIDVNGGPDAKAGAAPSIEAATEFAFALLEPTALVSSGYGIQAWWLFEEPWYFRTEDDREQAHRMSFGFQAALHAAAREQDWKFDSTHDLARLMRLPGTFNHKGGVLAPVDLLDHDGPRHSVETIGRLAHEHMSQAGSLVATLTGAAIEVNLNDPVGMPAAKILEVQELSAEFDVVWNHRQNKAHSQWTGSHYDLSIASHLVKVGFSDQEIAECIKHHRRRFYPDSDKGTRLDYLKRTIGKARGSEPQEESRREAEYERNDAIEQLVEVADAQVGEVANTLTVSLLTKAIGGPPVKELVQEGRDPDNSRFKLVLDDGREVPLGPIDGLIRQERFRERFATVTQHLPHRVKAEKWDDVVRSLLNAAVVREGEESTRGARACAWVEKYTDRRMSTDYNAACEAQDPFERDGYVHVALAPLYQWVRKIMGERLAEIDLKLMLETAGFERKVIAYTKAANMKRSSRSYYRIPQEALQAAAAAAAETVETKEDRDADADAA